MIKKLLKLVVLFTATLLLIVSCSKNDDEETTTPETPTSTVPVLEDNVKIIDQTKLQLDVTPTKIDEGIYQFTFTGTAPTIKSGDLIVGDQGEGFIRNVTASKVDGNIITLQTTQASMADLFKEGGFNFSLNMNDLTEKKAASGFSYTISNRSIYQEGPLSIVLNKGQIDFDPNWFFDFKFNKTGLTFFELSAKNAKLNGELTATVTAAQATTLVNQSSSILSDPDRFTKKHTVWVPAVLLGIPVLVPVRIVAKLDLILDYSATINAAITRQTTFTSTNTFNLGIQYANGQWNDINSFSTVNKFTLSQRTGNAKATINLALTPKVSFRLYNQAGPYASVSLMEQLSGAIASPSLDWDFKADVWLKATAGVEIEILDFDKLDYNKSIETEKLFYTTPYKIESVSGNSQVGEAGKQLSNPLKVRIIDNLEKIQSNVPVYFKVESGGGSVQTSSIMTDENGFAQTTWKLGTSGEQVVTVSAKKGDGTNILGVPVTFTALFKSLIGTWTLISATPAIGTFVPDYIQCVGNGDIVMEENRINSGQMIVTKDGGQIIFNSTQKYNNITYDDKCKVTQDSPDTFTEGTDNAAFTYDEKSFFIKDVESGTIDTYSYTLLSANKVSVLGCVFERK
ncbi:hypothetical protein [Flavobacterium sp. FlaQc-50]|uniref:hypothetical protein n=1 Tax=unclassified Flavobacterium TaxID=196869 RepID=UPI003757BE6D